MIDIMDHLLNIVHLPEYYSLTGKYDMAVKEKIKRLLLKGKGRLIGILRPEQDPYSENVQLEGVSNNASNFAKDVRGINRKPALMIYGVAPRCGTNYIGPLIALHPDVSPWPNEIYEIPFLRLTNHLLDFEKEYFQDYKLNAEKMGKNDFLALFGASFIGYMYSFVSDQSKKMLLKEPDVRYLSYYPLVFPNEELLLLLRDGRDVVYSTLKSWPSWNFADACHRWEKSANLMLKFDTQHKQNPRYWMVKYEDVLADPASFVKESCKRFSLDGSKFPYDRISDLKIVGSSTESRKSGNVDWNHHVDRPRNFKPIGRWQEWPPAKKATFKKIAGQTLLDAGYCTDLEW